MKLEDAVRHLKSVGLAAVMPDGKLHPISRSLRHPRGWVPVRIVKNGDLPKGLRDMMRRSRAESRVSRKRNQAR